MIPAMLFLLAAFARADTIDENFEIPANDWRYVPRPLTQQPAMVDCVFQSDGPDAQVRLVLLSHADLNAWRVGREHEEIAATPSGPRGALHVPVHDLDTYVAIENRASRPVRVRLRVFLEQPPTGGDRDQLRSLLRDCEPVGAEAAKGHSEVNGCGPYKRPTRPLQTTSLPHGTIKAQVIGSEAGDE
jgi:hypothetical protein